MTDPISSPTRSRLERWGMPIALLGLAFMAMGNIIPNHFVRDDNGLIFGNELVHHWSGVVRAFGAAYWPPEDSGELYRPLSIAWLTVQWQIGGGRELIFRLVSVAAYGASCLAVWALLKRLTTPAAAWVGAALFAVHPVHVEAMVEAVSQSESIVATLLCWAAAVHIDANAGRLPVGRASSLASLCFAIALLFKEHALVLIALFPAIDLMVDAGPGTWVARWRQWRAHYGALVLIAAIFWVTRGIVLGSGAGTHPAEAVAGDLLERTRTMAGVPAEWLRLFLWPAHLQDEWSLLEWVPTTTWTLRETAGLIALLSLVLATGLAWRRRAVLAFGLIWMGICLGPVANILMPTGVVIAERTLFLPSVGLAIVIASLVSLLEFEGRPVRPVWRVAGLTLFGGLLGLGIVRSVLREVDWRNSIIWSVRSIELAPLSWRTHLSYGMVLASAGDSLGAQREVRAAMALRPDDALMVKRIADQERLLAGDCFGPVLVYRELVARFPGRSDARASFVACLAKLGRYAEAQRVAEAGVAAGPNADFYAVVARRAGIAMREKTPVGKWRVIYPFGNATQIGPSQAGGH